MIVMDCERDAKLMALAASYELRATSKQANLEVFP